MLYDLATFSVWLFVALVIGIAVGWSTYSETPRHGWLSGWTLWALLAFVVGLTVAMLKLLPGRAGLWLEIALLMTFSHTLGCLMGGWLKSLFTLQETGIASAVADAGPTPEAVANQAARAIAERRTVETAARAEAERRTAEADAKAKAERRTAEARDEAERLAAESAARAEAERRAAEAATKAEAERRAAEVAAKADSQRRAAEAAAKAEAERRAAQAAAKAEADRLATEAAARVEAEREAAAKSLVAVAPPGMERLMLAAPNGAADNLKLIKGVGPKNEQVLNGLGIYHFHQIADWSPEHAVWIGHHMAFPGRVERENWIAQAKLLAAGLDTEHSAGVKSGAIRIDDGADSPLSETEASALAASLPTTLPKVEGEEKHSGSRPLGLASPRGGVADDLKRIKGIGKQNEARLHGLGVWHFRQIAAWSPENVKWVGSYLSFSGRIDREQWMSQAKELAAGRQTEFAKRVEKGLVKTSRDDGSRGQNNLEPEEPTRE